MGLLWLCAMAAAWLAAPGAGRVDETLGEAAARAAWRRTPFAPTSLPAGMTAPVPLRGGHQPIAQPPTAAAAAAAGAGGESPWTAAGDAPVQIAVLHRHGARTAPVVEGANLVWTGCRLSEAGGAMARQLGRFLRARYAGTLPAEYDMAAIRSRSTDYERTVRTGVGLLRGMYEESLWGLPFVEHEPTTSDILLGFFYSWPSAVLHSPELLGYNAASAPATRRLFNRSEIAALGRLVGAEAVCADPAKATTCAMFAEDVATCRLSNGGLSGGLRRRLPRLLEVMSGSNYFVYDYNGSRPFDAAVGPYAGPVAQRIVDGFREALAARVAGRPAPAMQHYSAHDNTVFAALDALGALHGPHPDVRLRVPRFTAAVILELYANSTVRLIYTLMDQDHNSAYNVSVMPGPRLGCWGGGGLYYAPECPLRDLADGLAHRFASPTRAADTACFADPVDVASTRCRPSDATSAASAAAAAAAGDPRESYCVAYRRNCPAAACDPARVHGPEGPVAGRYVLAPDLSCRRLDPPTTKSRRVPVAATLIGGGLGLIAGAIIGVAGRIVSARRRARGADFTPVA